MSIVAGRATGSTGPSESTAATSNDSSREEAADRSASNRARSGGVRHLYIHVPFCAARCGYCDFVTVVGRRDHHRAYVEALLAELALERGNLASKLESVFLGGGTPTFTNHDALVRLLEALPEAEEVTVEANPETMTPNLARALREAGVTRVSLGAHSFQPGLLEVLERGNGPEAVRRAFYYLRDANFDNISLDLLYGIPGETPSELNSDLEQALQLGPDHMSCYELEAKPGTRFTRAWAAELDRQSEAMEGYFELVVEMLIGAGFRWYETSNFCKGEKRARHNLAYWRGRDYLGLGIGAVSTVNGRRWRNRPALARYIERLSAGVPPPRETEDLPQLVRTRERLMLGLRLDERVPLADVWSAIDPHALARLDRLGLVELGGGGLRLTPRARLVGDAVTVALLAESPANDRNSAVA